MQSPHLAVCCTNCGARQSLDAVACSFCLTETAWAHELRRRATDSVSWTARQALIWSLVGVPACCFIFPAIIGIVLGARACRMARAHKIAVPARARGAIAAGLFSIFALVAVAGWCAVDQRDLEQRSVAAAAEAARLAPARHLDEKAACALVLASVLQSGFDGISAISVHSVTCDGRLVETADRAALDDVRIVGTSETKSATACFHRGQRWSLAKLTVTGGCSP